MNKPTKLEAVQFALNEIGKDSSVDAAQRLIDRFERRANVARLLDELIEFVRERKDSNITIDEELGVPDGDWEAYEEDVVGAVE